MLNAIVSAPGAALALSMAARNEPGPVGNVVVTVNVAADASEGKRLTAARTSSGVAFDLIQSSCEAGGILNLNTCPCTITHRSAVRKKPAVFCRVLAQQTVIHRLTRRTSGRWYTRRTAGGGASRRIRRGC
jgi:hypothetical protein